MSTSFALKTWRRLSGTATGRYLFSRIVCFKAPYFRSIKPVFDVLEPGRSEATLPPVREGEAQDAVVSVDVFNEGGERVVHADITMYVSPKVRAG